MTFLPSIYDRCSQKLTRNRLVRAHVVRKKVADFRPLDLGIPTPIQPSGAGVRLCLSVGWLGHYRHSGCIGINWSGSPRVAERCTLAQQALPTRPPPTLFCLQSSRQGQVATWVGKDGVRGRVQRVACPVVRAHMHHGHATRQLAGVCQPQRATPMFALLRQRWTSDLEGATHGN